MKRLCVLLLVSLFLSHTAHAQSSGGPIISYQGTITNSDGSLGDGSFHIAVSLWTAETGGSQIWSDEYVTQVTQGVFNLGLGAAKPLPPATTMDKSLWVSVAVNGTPPGVRTRLTAVPMALNVADSSITSAKLATDYVRSISVNGQKVTGKGTTLNIEAGGGLQMAFDDATQTLLLKGSATTLRQKGSRTQGITDFIALTDASLVVNGYATGTATTVLHGTKPPSYSAVDLLADVTNALPFLNGGTATVGGTVIPKWAASQSGGNSASGGNAAVTAGSQNEATEFAAVVSGGLDNKAFGDDDVVAGGEGNWVGSDIGDANSWHSTISGGANNTALGIGTAIPGGTSLTLGGFSFGFNGDDSLHSGSRDGTIPNIALLTDLSAFQGIGYLGNVNLWIGNVDSVAREIRFYEPNTSRTYAWPNYTAFKAGLQSTNIVYTLPLTLPLTGQVLKANSVSGSFVSLAWATDTGTGGGGGGVDSDNYWGLSGNVGTSAGPNYIGTQDKQAFEIHVNNSATSTGGNQRVMRFEEGATSPNIIGGSSADTIAPGLSGAAILSGGSIASPNKIGAFANSSVIAGGAGNWIQTDSDYAGTASILGGFKNAVFGSGGAIGGGWNNTIGPWAYHSVIAGGIENTVDTFCQTSTISGGIHNTVQSIGGAIGGGGENILTDDASYAVIAGGQNDSIQAIGGVVSGGYSNKILPDTNGYSTIAGGYINVIDANAGASVIGGGQSNYVGIMADHSVIAGGDTNRVFSDHSAIGGGSTNITASPYTTIAGGQLNRIYDAGDWSTIGGGRYNIIEHPTFNSSAQYNTIAGGDSNQTWGIFGTIGGGHNNTITVGGIYAAIPGGDSLIANGYGQTALGHFNSPSPSDLLSIGNGSAANRGNAFSISDSGAATATQNLGVPGPGPNQSTMGTIYANNTLIAWGSVIAGAPTKADGIGCVVTKIGTGSYQIILTGNVKNADGSFHTFTNDDAACVATISCIASAMAPGWITVSTLTAGVFTVNMWDSISPAPHLFDFGFQFHVVAR